MLAGTLTCLVGIIFEGIHLKALLTTQLLLGSALLLQHVLAASLSLELLAQLHKIGLHQWQLDQLRKKEDAITCFGQTSSLDTCARIL